MKPVKELMQKFPVRTLDAVSQMYATEVKIDGVKGSVIFGYNKDGKQHVSFNPYNHKTPTWDMMCKLKDMFFEDEEEAIQIHPKKSEYVNIESACLHLWAWEGMLDAKGNADGN